MDGMASEAKISFFDIGNTQSSYLSIKPSIKAIFETAYKAGARIHSNSWGSSDGTYSGLENEVDQYMCERETNRPKTLRLPLTLLPS